MLQRRLGMAFPSPLSLPFQCHQKCEREWRTTACILGPVPVAAAGGSATADPLADMRKYLEGERAIVKQLNGGALFPVRGCSSSLCLHWMCMGIERNGVALQ
jgi:hypothetical protein